MNSSKIPIPELLLNLVIAAGNGWAAWHFSGNIGYGFIVPWLVLILFILGDIRKKLCERKP